MLHIKFRSNKIRRKCNKDDFKRSKTVPSSADILIARYRMRGNVRETKFRELRAELKFRVFIFANDCLIIYISYIAYILVLMFTLLSVQKDGGIVRFCELRARIPCVSRDLDCNGGRNADLQQGNT